VNEGTRDSRFGGVCGGRRSILRRRRVKMFRSKGGADSIKEGGYGWRGKREKRRRSIEGGQHLKIVQGGYPTEGKGELVSETHHRGEEDHREEKKDRWRALGGSW